MLSGKRILKGLAGVVLFGSALGLRVSQSAGGPIPTPIVADSPDSVPTTKRNLSAEARADIYMARKMYPDAIDYYRRSLDQVDSNAVVWNKLGIAYQMSLDYRDAQQSYRRAIRLQPGFAEAWNNLGTVYFLQGEGCRSHFGFVCAGKFKASIKQYEKALALTPASASYHMNMGASYSRLKKYEEAFAEYHAALAIDPDVLSKHSALGTVIEAGLSDVEYYFNLAKVFASLERPEDSVRYLKRAMEDGFRDFKRLDKDPDFLKISKYPEYVALRKNPPFAIPN